MALHSYGPMQLWPCTVVALCTYGLYKYGLYSCGPCSCDLRPCSYDLYSYGVLDIEYDRLFCPMGMAYIVMDLYTYGPM